MAEEDIIWGKNRHMFGGIEPSNMLVFTARVVNGFVTLDAELPKDTVIDGQTLCTVGGAVIRRKLLEYPVDEFDGELVADIKENKTVVDKDTIATGTYYYAAFPYSSQGVYNRSVSNRVVINEPGDMVTFKTRKIYDETGLKPIVEITAELPQGVDGVVIRKSIYGYPVDENDGEEFVNLTSDSVVTDNNVEVNNTYYYTAFTYKNTGEYNRSGNSRANITIPEWYLYGYDIDLNDSNPDTRVSYPSDVINAAYTPARMNFDTGVFDYGDWPSDPGVDFMPKPCVFSNVNMAVESKVDVYLDPNDHTKTVDGLDFECPDTGHPWYMMEWPKIWVKRWEENGVYHFRCSNDQRDPEYECWSNYDANGNQIDHFYTSMYHVSYRSSGDTGIIICPGHIPNSAYSSWNSIKNSWSEQNALSSYGFEQWVDHTLIQDLLVMMAKSTNGQSCYGYGRIGSSRAGHGGLKTKGLFWGSTDTSVGVKVFGMEHWWGNVGALIDGIDLHNGRYRIDCPTTPGQVDTLNTLPTYSSSISGYISGCATTKYGRLPISFSGSSTTYEADYMSYLTTSVKLASVRYESSGAMQNGPFSMRFAHNSTDDLISSTTYYRMSYKPAAVINVEEA